MKILVTGASGLLGSEIISHLTKLGHKIVGLFNNNSQLVHLGIKKFKHDISDPTFADNFHSAKFDLIIHCAALTNVNKCETDKKSCFLANVVGTRNVVSLAKKLNSKLIYISTPSVFDGITGDYRENDSPNPKNYYSLSKLLGEEAVLSYGQGLVVRTAPIGIHPLKRPAINFFEWLVDSIKNNKNIDLFSDVNFNPLSAPTLAKMILDINDKSGIGLIHIGSKNFLSKARVGKLVLTKFKNFKGKINLISVENKSGLADRPKEMWLNVDKALKLKINLPTLEEEIKFLTK